MSRDLDGNLVGLLRAELALRLGQARDVNEHPDLLVYFATTMAGGCHVPLPGGRIDGGSVFGQYRRITR